MLITYYSISLSDAAASVKNVSTGKVNTDPVGWQLNCTVNILQVFVSFDERIVAKNIIIIH